MLIPADYAGRRKDTQCCSVTSLWEDALQMREPKLVADLNNSSRHLLNAQDTVTQRILVKLLSFACIGFKDCMATNKIRSLGTGVRCRCARER